MTRVFTGLLLGLIAAAALLTVPLPPTILAAPPPANPGDRGQWGPLSLDQVRRLAELRTLRVEVSSLQEIHREKARRYTFGQWRNWRDFAVVVPVQCELGIPFDEVTFHRNGDRWTVRIPPARVVQATPIYARDRMLIWKDAGNAFREEDLFGEAVRSGRAAAIDKCRSLGMPDRATELAADTLRTLATLAGIHPDQFEIEVRIPRSASPRLDRPAASAAPRRSPSIPTRVAP